MHNKVCCFSGMTAGAVQSKVAVARQAAHLRSGQQQLNSCCVLVQRMSVVTAAAVCHGSQCGMLQACSLMYTLMLRHLRVQIPVLAWQHAALGTAS